jgi:hypothetical protein
LSSGNRGKSDLATLWTPLRVNLRSHFINLSVEYH